MNNYTTEILQSIDTIVSAKLNEVAFNRTEICKIVSQSEENSQQYWVTNEIVRFEVYNPDSMKKYVVGQKVYVLVPNGNYGEQKIILGSYEADNENKRKQLWTNPFDHMVVSSQYNWIPWYNGIEPQYLQVPATCNEYEDKSHPDLQASLLESGLTFYYSGLGQFNYIGLDFSATTGFGGTQGNFQIIIDLLDAKGISLLTPKQLGLLTLDSSQLHGNPYYLNSFLRFQHLFDFPIDDGKKRFTDLTKVKQVRITLRALDNFNYSKTDGDTSTPVIKINDLTVYFGFDSTQFEGANSTLKLRLGDGVEENENLIYKDANDTKDLWVEWMLVDDENKTKFIYNKQQDQQYPEINKYNIYWLQYDNSVKQKKRLESTIPILKSAYYQTDKDGKLIPKKDDPTKYEINTKTNYCQQLDKVFPLKRVYTSLQQYDEGVLYNKYSSWWKDTLEDFKKEITGVNKTPGDDEKYLTEEDARYDELLSCYVEKSSVGVETSEEKKARKEQYQKNLNNPYKIIINEVLSKYNKEDYDFYCGLYKNNESEFLQLLEQTFQDLEEPGVYWKTVKKKDASKIEAYTYTLVPSKEWKGESIKALIKNRNTETILPSDKTYQFLNEAWRAETGSNQGKQDTLLLTLGEGDDGVYNSYGIDNKLLFAEYAPHTLTVDYVDSGLAWDDSIQKVVWKIPKKASMITLAKEMNENNEYQTVSGWADSQDGLFYIYENTGSNGDAKTIKFGLNQQFNFACTNNTIYCDITRYKSSNSQEIYDTYSGSIELKFGTQGTSGSGYALNIVPSSLESLLLGEDPNNFNTITYTATLEANNGQPLQYDTTKLKWYYRYGDKLYNTNSNGNTYSIKSNLLTDIVGITVDENGVEKPNSPRINNPDFGYYLTLVAQLEDWTDISGNTINLTAYYPLARTINKNYYISGASRILYNYQGTGANYDDSIYELYEWYYDETHNKMVHTKINNIKWAVLFDGYDEPKEKDKDGNIISYKYIRKDIDEHLKYTYLQRKGKIKTPNGEIVTETGAGMWDNVPSLQLEEYDEDEITKEPEEKDYTKINYTLKPMSNIPTNVKPTAIVAVNTKNEILYVQPLLITRNSYAFDTLNSWNGSLKIDTENNEILTALIAAGTKNEDNQFTGVLMGAVGKWGNATTGIYGMAAGELRYKLDEKGDFYVGTGSDNRIDFSGSAENKTLTIEAKSFKLTTNKLLIDSSSGIKLLNSQDKVTIEFQNDGDATISGWNIDENQINSTTNRKISGVEYPFKTFIQNGGSGTNAFGIYYTKDKDNIYPFRVTHEGKLYASGADISGDFKISASSTIEDEGQQKILNTFIKTTAEGAYIKAENYVNEELKGYAKLEVMWNALNATVSNEYTGESFGWKLISNEFSVYSGNDSNKVLKVTSSGLTVKGKIQADSGYIGGQTNGWYIQDKEIGTGSVHGGGTGMIISTQHGILIRKSTGNGANDYIDNVQISTDGNVRIRGNLHVTGTGSIAGWTINGSEIKKGTTILSSSTTNGKFTCYNGVIGGWNIGSDGITNGNTGLYSNGNFAFFPSGGAILVGNNALRLKGPSGIAIYNSYTNYSNDTTINNGIEICADGDLSLMQRDGLGGLNIRSYISPNTKGNAAAGAIQIQAANNITIYAHNKNIYIQANTGTVYARSSITTSNSPIKTDAGSTSSRSTKTNINYFTNIDYIEALDLLSQINIASYEYKYKIYEKKKQYGFIIDDIEQLQGYNKFFDFKNDVAAIKNGYADLGWQDSDDDYSNCEKINIKTYNSDVLDKYLLTVCKALQQEIEKLKQEIKEIKQNET